MGARQDHACTEHLDRRMMACFAIRIVDKFNVVEVRRICYHLLSTFVQAGDTFERWFAKLGVGIGGQDPLNMTLGCLIFLRCGVKLFRIEMVFFTVIFILVLQHLEIIFIDSKLLI